MNANEKHGCHGGDGATLPTTPLTAEQASKIANSYQILSAWEPAFRAIASGVHVVVPRWTEAEAIAEFVRRFGECPSVEMYARDWQSEQVGWLAALRAAGFLKGDKT